ncbi:MAG: aminotransferase, partial [Opitutae bacterium]|nr:aminotransferase [Opitutae bacterium]
SCSREGTEMKALGKTLAAENIVVSVRTERSGRDYLRFSPHFYNTSAELECAVEVL